MKLIRMAVTAVVLMMLLAPHYSAHAADSRHGVVVAMEAIDNRGDDESQVTKTKRKWGRFLGTAGRLGMVATRKGGTAGAVVADSAEDIGEVVATKVGDQGPTTRYMVKVKLDSGKTLAITQLREQLKGIEPGSRVRVEGKGGSALVHKE